jgi:predicted NBD/HSP70 family sugar kinase/biotin operon repressor
MGTARVLRDANVRSCLRLLRDKGPLSRAELARELGTTRTTVGYAIAELEKDGLVRAAGNASGRTIGRPGVAVMLEPSGAYFLGVEVEADRFTIVLADFMLQRKAFRRFPWELATAAPMDLCRAIAGEAGGLATGRVLDRISGLGVSMPGIITPAGRVILPGLPNWSDVPLQGILEDLVPDGWVVRCCNDAVAFALGHTDRLAASEKEDLFVLLLARGGIGSVRMRSGVVDRGVQGTAGEIGLILREPLPGGRGRTFQQVALSLLPSAAVVDPGAPDLPWHDWDDAIGRWAEAIARGLLDVIYLLDPAKVVVMGALAPLFERARDRIDGHLAAWLMPGLKAPEIDVVAPLPEAAVMGAAALVREELFAMPRIGEAASSG